MMYGQKFIIECSVIFMLFARKNEISRHSENVPSEGERCTLISLLECNTYQN
jgi:hypothetical protein